MAPSLKDVERLFDRFAPAGSKEWEAAAREELNGANPWEKLSHQGEGWSARPYYPRDEQSITSPNVLPVSTNEFLGPRTWFNCPRIVVDDSKKSNKAALTHLQEGADGILFELNDTVDFNALLEDIQLPYCALIFLAKEKPADLAASLQKFLVEKNSAGTSLQGSFFGNTTIGSGYTPAFKFSGFQIPATTNPSADIAAGFNAIINASGTYLDAQINSFALSVTIEPDFFLEIAKLRAIRKVWRRLLTTRGLPAEATIYIHAVSLPWKTNDFEPHGNMLKSTTAAMSSILGGCDALTIDADGDQAMLLRVARNVSNLLREESFFSKVADPVAGSYFVEDLTHQIAEGAWNSIQTQ